MVPVEISGYTVVPGQEVTIPTDTTPVEIHYIANDQTVTVHYVFEKGGQAAAAQTITGKTDATFSLTSPVIEGYVADSLIVTGKYLVTGNDYTVTYTGTVHTFTVQPKDPDGNNVGNPIEVTGKAGEAITVPNVPGYEYVGQEVKVLTTTTEVPLVYQPTEHTVVITPIDKNGKPIGDAHTVTVKTGESLTVPVIPGYTFTGTVPTISGNGAVTLTYTANPVPKESSAESVTSQPTKHESDSSPVAAKQASLPQTGEEENSELSVLGITGTLMTMFGLFGIARKRKRKDE